MPRTEEAFNGNTAEVLPAIAAERRRAFKAKRLRQIAFATAREEIEKSMEESQQLAAKHSGFFQNLTLSAQESSDSDRDTTILKPRIRAK